MKQFPKAMWDAISDIRHNCQQICVLYTSGQFSRPASNKSNEFGTRKDVVEAILAFVKEDTMRLVWSLDIILPFEG